MSVTAIVGANWGDEGKGKLTDYLSEQSDIVVRFQGGNNAGHTIINKYGKHILHLLPSGVFNPNVVNVIGHGVAVNIPAIMQERKDLADKGVPEAKLLISDRAQVLMDYHVDFDEYEEERLAKNKYGSTKRGIAPFYSDKYYKIGIQINELFDLAKLRERLSNALQIKNALLEHLYHKPKISLDREMETLAEYAEMVRPFVADTAPYLNKSVKNGKKILLEGQLGALRDPEHGIYPFSTSSSTLAGYASVGAGIPPYEIKNILAVTKAYSSSVGAGPFVAEITDPDEAEELRRRGGDAGEYGATTKRPRNVGWFDVVATSYGCMVQGATHLALTNLDVLSYLDEIPVVVAYDIDGKQITNFPVTPLLNYAKPLLKTLPGWKCDIRGIRTFEELPRNAKSYVRFISQSVGVPVKWLSVGPKREETMMIDLFE